jgi:hypothetical protein
LVVYVDDFKMAGPKAAMAEGWRLIRRNIRMDNPTPLDKYLGCEHKVRCAALDPGGDPSHAVFAWGKPRDTPAVSAAGGISNAVSEPTSSEKSRRNVRVMEYDMSGFFASCVDRYLELAGPKCRPLRKVDTPFVDKNLGETPGGSDAEPGELQPIASKVLMRILYGARMCRFDLLRAVCHLATKVTKWTRECDRALHRLVSYIHHTLDVRMLGWVGNPVEEWELVVYSDADFGGDPDTSRSTTGVFVCVRASHTFFPLSATSKRQSCVSHSTPEAEIVAADHAIRAEALPGLQLWDNAAALRIIETGKSPALRHLGRTHRVDLAFLHETYKAGQFSAEDCSTDKMCADIFTKAFPNKDKWLHACRIIGHVVPDNFWHDYRPGGVAYCKEPGGNSANKSKGGQKKTAAPAARKENDRLLVELCCNPDSRLGCPSKASEGCEVVRVTIEHDITTAAGLACVKTTHRRARRGETRRRARLVAVYRRLALAAP